MIVKWVHRFTHPGNGEYRYHRDYAPHMTSKLSEATIHDVKYFVREIPGWQITQITQKELFAAKLKDA